MHVVLYPGSDTSRWQVESENCARRASSCLSGFLMWGLGTSSCQLLISAKRDMCFFAILPFRFVRYQGLTIMLAGRLQLRPVWHGVFRVKFLISLVLLPVIAV